MRVTWHAVDLKTGRRGRRLHAGATPVMSRIIGEATEVAGLAVACEVNGTPVLGWNAATLPGRMMLLAVDDDDDERILWGGMVMRRRSAETRWVAVDMVTLEGYLDRRFVTDHTFTATAQGAIVQGILTADALPTGVQFIVDAQSNLKRDRTYADDEDKTVLAALQELMEVEDGPDFTVDLEWSSPDRLVVNRILRVRDRIGTASTRPSTGFTYPGNIASFEYVEDYSGDNGANDVMATSSGEGDVRPESAHMVATDLLTRGWVKFEQRFTPSTSIVETATLDAHARERLAQTRDGLNQLTLTLAMSAAPLPGRDFRLGDDVAVSLTCPRFPEVTGPDGGRVPGYSETVRVTGYELDPEQNQVRPTLWEYAT